MKQEQKFNEINTKVKEDNETQYQTAIKHQEMKDKKLR